MTRRGERSWNSGTRAESLKRVAILKRLGYTRHGIAEILNFSPAYVAELSAEVGRKK